MAKWWFNKNDNETTPDDPPSNPPTPWLPTPTDDAGQEPPEPPGPVRLCPDLR